MTDYSDHRHSHPDSAGYDADDDDGGGDDNNDDNDDAVADGKGAEKSC